MRIHRPVAFGAVVAVAAITVGLSPLRAAASSSVTTLQQAELTASDGATNNYFGNSTAVYGINAVVGAPQNLSSGTAYVYVRAGSAWSQQAKLVASDHATGDSFGAAVAISRTLIVVGAPSKGSGKGAVYVFVQSGSTWTQQAKLTASDGFTGDGDNFGWSVTISGSTLIVGSRGETVFTGAAYVFTQSGTTWSQQAKLTASDGVMNDQFGWSVALSGNTAAVGAYEKNSFTGAVYVFVRSGTTWSQQTELAASDAVASAKFGWSVAISGRTVAVGSPWAQPSGSTTGAAYLFRRSGNAWSQLAELTGTDTAAGDNLGASVAISASTIMVGAPIKSSSTGVAYAFVASGANWVQEAEVTASDAASGAQFGASISLSGATALVGAPGKTSNTGAAYVYALPAQTAKLMPTGGSSPNGFGSSVATSDSTVAIGAQNENSNAGAAYVFVNSVNAWSQQARLTASDSAPAAFFGAAVAVSGSTAVIGAPGHNSSRGAAYVFTRSGSTWSQQAELTAPDVAANDEFGAFVAVSGSTVVVAAINNLFPAGAAYVFVASGSTWSQQAKLTPSATQMSFRAVAISGSTVLVGGTHTTNSDVGAAFVFVRSGTAWNQQAELTASDGAAGDRFADSLALAGSTAVVGADQKNSGNGAAYVFVRSGITWSQQAELAEPNPGPNKDEFGVAVAVSGSTVVVTTANDQSNSTNGAAFVYVAAGATWSLLAKLTASDAATGTYFARGIGVSGSTVAAGSPGNGALYVYAL